MPDLAAAPAAPSVRPRPARPAPSTTTLPGSDLRAVRASIGGLVLVAGDAGYDDARGAHNTHYDRKPAMIVRPETAIDVARAVVTARDLDLEIAVKGGGHSVAGHSTSDGGMLIDLGAMRAIDIDPVRGIGSAQGGATAGEYTWAANQLGFATPFGDTGSVGLGGLTLGGGIGWLARKHGLTIDSLVEVDLVTADGHLITVNEDDDPDLFWAVRGGGGNFGIVTRFRYRLHPVNMVTGGMLVLPLTQQVLRDVVDASVAAPEELTQITFVMGLPPAPFVPAEAVGMQAVIVMPVHAGPLEDGAAAMAPFRSIATPLADMVGPMPYPAMYQLTAAGEQPGPGVIRSSFMPDLDAAAIDTIVERHRGPQGDLAMTQLRVLGGAVARVPAGATAFAHRDATVMASVLAHGEAPYEDLKAYAESYHAELSGRSTGVYSNFVGEEDASRLHAAYPGATFERLVQVKRRVDPENVFHANHNIRPD